MQVTADRPLRRRATRDFAIQLPDQLLQQLRELAGHHREVQIELLGRIDLLLIPPLRRDLEELDRKSVV